jgi:hypothetical protein
MAWIQTSYPTTTGTGQGPASITTQFEGNTTSGNCIVVCITWSTAGGQGVPSTVTDSQGNTYTQVGGTSAVNTSATQACGLWVCLSCTGGSAPTITCTFTLAGAAQAIIAGEYSGVNAVDVYKVSAASGTSSQFTIGTANSAQIGSVTTTTAGDTVVACFVNGNAEDDFIAGTTPGQWVKRGSTCFDFSNDLLHTPPTMMMEDYVQPSAGAINASATVPGTAYSHSGSGWDFVGMAVALKAAATGGIETRASGLVATYTPSSGYTGTGTSKSVSVTTQAGDYLVVCGGGENSGLVLSTPSGNGVSFTLQQSIVVSNFSTAYTWTGQDMTGGTWSLSSSVSASTNQWGFTCFVFRGIGGFGNSAKSNQFGYPATMGLATKGNNSSVVVFSTDFDAVFGGTGSGTVTDIERWWQGTNGAAPSAGNGMEIAYGTTSTRTSGNAYTAYCGIYKNVGVPGIKIMGLQYPDLQNFSMIALEVLAPGTGGMLPYVLDPTTLYELSESFDTYSNATTVTTASNPTKFTSVQSAASGTGVIDNTHVRSGSEALKITGTATSGNQFYVKYTFNATTDQTYIRGAFYLTAYPSSNSVLMGITTVNDSGNIDQANVAITTAGKIQIYDGGATTAFTGGTVSMPLNQWFTLEYHLDWPNTQETVRAYDSSGTLIDTMATANGIYGGVRPNAVKIGVLGAPGTTTPAATLTYWLDSVAVSKADWIGPA